MLGLVWAEEFRIGAVQSLNRKLSLVEVCILYVIPPKGTKYHYSRYLRLKSI